MDIIKYILRGTMLLLIILLLINLNRKTSTLERVARFKLETLKKINTDSLDAEGKLDFVVDETAKFSEKMVKESPSIKQSVRQLIRVVTCLILMELAFFIVKKRKPTA